MKNIFEISIPMKITEHIAQHLIDVFEGGNWTEVNIRDTLRGVNYKEATAITRVSSNSIAALLYHIGYYNKIVLKRIMGVDDARDNSNGFDMPAIQTEEDWSLLKERVMQSTCQLADTIRKFPEAQLFDLIAPGNSTYYKTFQGIVEHAHYHLGQIVVLKKLIKQPVHHHLRSKSL